jgi:hypothetical protein
VFVRAVVNLDARLLQQPTRAFEVTFLPEAQPQFGPRSACLILQPLLLEESDALDEEFFGKRLCALDLPGRDESPDNCPGARQQLGGGGRVPSMMRLVGHVTAHVMAISALRALRNGLQNFFSLVALSSSNDACSNPPEKVDLASRMK